MVCGDDFLRKLSEQQIRQILLPAWVKELATVAIATVWIVLAEAALLLDAGRVIELASGPVFAVGEILAQLPAAVAFVGDVN